VPVTFFLFFLKKKLKFTSELFLFKFITKLPREFNPIEFLNTPPRDLHLKVLKKKNYLSQVNLTTKFFYFEQHSLDKKI
jgi:hypothetical protein